MRVHKGTVSIVGQGYVGLPLAVAIAQAGYKTFGIEINKQRYTKLRNFEFNIEDVNPEVLRNVSLTGGYTLLQNYESISISDVVILCVPTPIDFENQPDLRALIDAVTNVGKRIVKETLLISESTSYPGTLRYAIKETLEKHLAISSNLVNLAVAPERIDPGNKEYSSLNTPRVVSGLTSNSNKIAKEFYESIGMSVISVSSPEVAEAAKLLENSFRQVNIALVNEFAQLSHALKINVREVLDAAGTKPYGFMKFSPGAGVGGHCIPVDPYYLSWIARQHGFTPKLLDTANKINHEMPEYVVKRFTKFFPETIVGKKILIAGVAYKQGLSDFRESPSIKIIDLLQQIGAQVKWHDPLVRDFRDEIRGELHESYDGVVLTLPSMDLPMNDWIRKSIKIFDCTGYYRDVIEINQL